MEVVSLNSALLSRASQFQNLSVSCGASLSLGDLFLPDHTNTHFRHYLSTYVSHDS